MNLRLRSNSIRVRMDRKDLAELLQLGRVIDLVRFGPGRDRMLVYAVVVGPAPPERPRADYANGLFLVTIDRRDVETWAAGGRAGFGHVQVTGDGVVRVTLENDPACRDRSAPAAPEGARPLPGPSGGDQ